MERLLGLKTSKIKEKVKRLLEIMKNKKWKWSESEHFLASRGWFMCLKECIKHHSHKLQGKAASGAKNAAKVSHCNYDEIINNFWGNYASAQACSANIYQNHLKINNEEKAEAGHKVSKEGVTLLLGAIQLVTTN